MPDPTSPASPGEPETDLARTPLFAEHVALGATMVPFAGWSMPVKYGSDVAEHQAVRTAAGLFDVSHMAEIEVRGPDAAAFLDHALAGRLSAIAVDQARYSLILTPRGGILDDLIVYRSAADGFLVVANAGNRAAVVTALAERASGFDVEVDDCTDHIALIAVQGPASQRVLEATIELIDLSQPLDTLRYYRRAHAVFDPDAGEQVPVHLARTGYTGEDGFELYIRATSAVALWRALLEAGRPFGLVPAGLAARDTLRLEAGMPLYGHELGLGIQPVQAGLGRVVVTAKDDFVGKAAVLAGPAADAPVLVGLASAGRRAGRAGYPVTTPDGEVVGEVTSGVLSPTLGHPIAMAFVRPEFAEPGTELAIDVRGTALAASVVPLPFYTRPADPDSKEQ